VWGVQAKGDTTEKDGNSSQITKFDYCVLISRCVLIVSVADVI